MLEEARNEPRGVVTYHKVTLKKKHRRNHSQRASGEKNEVKQQAYEDSEKNTKICSKDEKNREEQSQSQAREEHSQRQARKEHSQRQAREEQSQRQAREEHGQQQAKQPKDCDRDKAQYEEKHTTQKGCSNPSSQLAGSRCPPGATRAEA